MTKNIQVLISLVAMLGCSDDNVLPITGPGGADGAVGGMMSGTPGSGTGGSVMGAGGTMTVPKPGAGSGGAPGAAGGGGTATGGAVGSGGTISPKVDAGTAGGGVKCGDNTCAVGQVCCNPSCGTCAPPNGACTLQFCLPKPDAGVTPGGACKVDGDCRLVDDYCTGCNCRALNQAEVAPVCSSGAMVQCLIQPCAAKMAACEAGKCVSRAKDAAAAVKWFLTCGDPVCRVGGWRDKGLPKCTTEKAGGACAKNGDKCDPGNDCNETLICQSTDPMMAPGGCPKSRASTKRDIRYLGPDELQRYHDELLQMKLATWKYKADPTHERFGFIIDDNEKSVAVDASRDMVDLYGYTSLAVATVQLQSRELAQLRKELASLRRLVEGKSGRAANGR